MQQTKESNMKTNRKQLRKNRGQGMTEYIIIVALIAIAAIGVITLFGDNIRKLFGASAQALAGQSSLVNPGDSGARNELRNKTMNNFGQNNAY
jgi:pilus assembly protein Flp/PilA